MLPLPADGQFQWTAPDTGTWEITFIRHLYRSSPTRAGQREDGTRDKDSLYSLIDYLDPEATATYIKLVQETYGKVAGDEFGKTIFGFRGDETDYTGFMPWTPKLLDTFQKQKGYDLTPYIAQFFVTPLSQEPARQGRLLGRVERHVPRQFLQADARVVPGAQYGVYASPEP